MTDASPMLPTLAEPAGLEPTIPFRNGQRLRDDQIAAGTPVWYWTWVLYRGGARFLARAAVVVGRGAIEKPKDCWLLRPLRWRRDAIVCRFEIEIRFRRPGERAPNDRTVPPDPWAQLEK